ncbi:MAG: aromatic ring-hydroxylating dioxygenase subunit alpha [Gammaproteobacteria bacterium]|nr:aromatic ring-hydroxylating dioxygenase subunit alpha [Gammaproteobacteria bacterium]
MPQTNMLEVSSDPLSFDPERALPAIAFRDPTWLASEMQHIWHNDWVFATTESALASRGDQVPIVVGDEHVLLMRNQENELVALSNLCAHRGTLLVEEPTNAKRVQCPYHAWTYDDGGRLIGVPFAPKNWSDRSAHCLPTYRVESWHGLVFVSLNLEVEPVAERFAAIDSYVSKCGIGDFVQDKELQKSEVWECNWKLSLVNAMESYHLFKVHPKTLEPFAPTKGSYYISGSARATVTGGTSPGQEDYLLMSLPPSFVGVITDDSFVWQAVQPNGTHGCVVSTGGAMGRRDDRTLGPVGKWLTRMAVESFPLADFLPEDKAICERVQRGFTGHYTPGRILPVERVVVDFGHYLNWRLNKVEPPPVHTEPTL